MFISHAGVVNAGVVNEGNLIDDPLIDSSWVTDQPNFNYRLPCDIDKINAVVIILHGTNRKDLVSTDNEQGKLLYSKDLSSTYPIMDKFCVITVIPKSVIIKEDDEEGVARLYRSWWMSNKRASYGDDLPEIRAVLNIVNLAKSAVNKPIFIAKGHDGGALQMKILDKNYFLWVPFREHITGFVEIDYLTGEFAAHFLNGTVWLSEDH
jgi:hypothetical protein